jgi:hypothetical protein
MGSLFLSQVNFQALVCFDSASYVAALKSEEPMRVMTVEDVIDMTSDTSPIERLSRTPSPRMSIVTSKLQPDFKVVASPVTPAITVELREIELGRIEIREAKECYFTLQNLSDVEVECEVINKPVISAIFRKFETRITLKPNETRTIYTTFTPTSLGRNSGVIFIRESSSKLESAITFKWYAVLHSYIRFDTIDQEIDFGFCYVDASKRFAKVEAIRLENTASHDLFVSVVSNLTLQCFIFADAGLTEAISDLYFPKKSCIIVYVALQPHLNQLGKGGGESDARTLVFFWKVLIYDRLEASSFWFQEKKRPVLIYRPCLSLN